MSLRARGIAVAAFVAATVIPVAAASAQVPPYANPNPPVVDSGTTNLRTVDPKPVKVLPSTVTRSSGGLPVTGGDVVGLVVLGGGLAGAGLVLRGAARRRTPAEA